MPCSPRICKCGSWFPRELQLRLGRGLSEGRKNSLFASYTCRLDTSVHNTVAFPSVYIYNNASSKWHKRLVAPPSYYLESQDEVSVQLDNHLPHTSSNPARAPRRVFCFLDGITVSQLPINDRFDCDTAALQLLMLLFRRHRFRRTFAPCLSCLRTARLR